MEKDDILNITSYMESVNSVTAQLLSYASISVAKDGTIAPFFAELAGNKLADLLENQAYLIGSVHVALSDKFDKDTENGGNA